MVDCAMSQFSYGKLETMRLAGKQLPVAGGGETLGTVTVTDPGTSLLLADGLTAQDVEVSLELPEADAKLVTLSTCTYEFDNARYVVVGVLTLVEEAANS